MIQQIKDNKMGKKVEVKNPSVKEQIKAGQKSFEGMPPPVPEPKITEDNWQKQRRRKKRNDDEKIFERVLTVPLGRPLEEGEDTTGKVVVRPRTIWVEVGKRVRETLKGTPKASNEPPIVQQEKKEKRKREFKAALFIVDAVGITDKKDAPRDWVLILSDETPVRVTGHTFGPNGQYVLGEVKIGGQYIKAILLKTKSEAEELRSYFVYKFPSGTTTRSSDSNLGLISRSSFFAERIKRKTATTDLTRYRFIYPQEITFVNRDSYGNVINFQTYHAGDEITLGINAGTELMSSDLGNIPHKKATKK